MEELAELRGAHRTLQTLGMAWRDGDGAAAGWGWDPSRVRY